MKRLLLQCAVVVAAMALSACGGPGAFASVENEVDDGLGTTDGALTSSSRASTWLPLQEGNRWVFRSTSDASHTRTITVDLWDAQQRMGAVSGLFDEPRWVGFTSTTTSTLSVWRDDSETWAPLVRFGSSSASWKTGTSPCKDLVGKREGTGVVVETPVTRYADTRRIGFDWVTSPEARCARPPFQELTFVPRVGLVAFTAGDGETFVLESALVNGTQLPAAPPVQVRARVFLDHGSYTSTAGVETAVATITFDLANTGANAARWEFATGCQLDVEIADADGRVVKRLSDEQACSAADTTLVLESGQSKAYSVQMELKDADGKQLDGTYTVRAKLTPSTGAATAPKATRTLRVDVLTP